MNKTLRADLLLLLIALIWGATFPLVKAALADMGPFLLVTARFSVAALFLLIYILPVLKKTNAKVLWAGLILGLLNAGVYLLQTFGMHDVDADTSAFIAAMGVVFVPFLAPLFKLNRVRKIEVGGSLVCLLGLYVLIGANFDDFKIGQCLILLASVSWAASVCYIQKVTQHIEDGRLLAFYQVVFTLPLAFICSGMEHVAVTWSPMVIFTILYTGIFATGIVFLIQVRYQKETTATHAAIIYSLEPVFASIFAIFINHQALTVNIVSGGGIILFSIFLIELFPRIQVQWKKRS